MKKINLRYLIQISILTVAIVIIYLLLINFYPTITTVNFLYAILVFPITHILFHFSITKNIDNRKQQVFINKYMATTVAKLMIYMAIMLIYTLLIKHKALQFIIAFFISYLLYTFFEIYSLMKINKELNSNTQ